MARKSNSSNGSTKQSSDIDETNELDNKEAVETASDSESSDAETSEQTAVTEPENENEAATSRSDDSDETLEAEVVELADEPETESLAETEAVASPEPVIITKKSGGLGAIFGGLLAGAIGFLAATFLVPEGWPNGNQTNLSDAISEQSQRLDGLAGEFASVKESLSAVSVGSSDADLAALNEAMAQSEANLSELAASMEEQIAGLGAQISDVEARLALVEARPAGPASPDGSAAMEAQLNAFRQQLDDVTADAEARIAEAQERASEIEAAAAAAQAAAERDAALSSLKTAMDTGTPFAETLAAFPDAPDNLKSVAAQGVPTLTSLQRTFAAAARTALANSGTVEEEASTGEKIVDFLRRQTNARSLAPLEGESVNAILSRAEAALGNGDLDTVLTELNALPETARNSMMDWIGAAEMRAAALASVAKLQTPTN